jgi:hypothetical protein
MGHLNTNLSTFIVVPHKRIFLVNKTKTLDFRQFRNLSILYLLKENMHVIRKGGTALKNIKHFFGDCPIYLQVRTITNSHNLDIKILTEIYPFCIF